MVLDWSINLFIFDEWGNWAVGDKSFLLFYATFSYVICYGWKIISGTCIYFYQQFSSEFIVYPLYPCMIFSWKNECSLYSFDNLQFEDPSQRAIIQISIYQSTSMLPRISFHCMGIAVARETIENKWVLRT